jgi:transposase
MGPLSVDLRKRVVSAVREGGVSCPAAAKRFGVSFASAIRWVAALRERGSFVPLPMGGDQRSGRVEAHADYLLGLHRREPDLTLAEICDRLERVRAPWERQQNEDLARFSRSTVGSIRKSYGKDGRGHGCYSAMH